ncbi:MAG: hypothetical protein LBM18_00325 [Oscillospiraceae bacterium]|jgi:hypothetical protein|nr:hypothetical protein [Oscillospiraceae bacterium]
MNALETDKKCMASIALFGELARKNMDVYQTLAVFIKYVIYTKKYQFFSVSEMVCSLLEYFDFSIPEVVVKNSLRKIPELSLADKIYSRTENITIDIDLEKKKESIENSQDKITNSLFEYIQAKAKRFLNQSEKDRVIKILYEYLINDIILKDYWGKYIHSFIITNEKNLYVIDALRLIKEGALLYSAFQYTPEEYSTNTWSYETVFYFDTEILFSVNGFNGDLYKKIVHELLDLIKAVNTSSKKKIGKDIIQLKYFHETKREIDSFFGYAERIVSGKQRAIQLKPAMRSIINGCNDTSEIREKKGLFWAYISSLGFSYDDEKIYDLDENLKYNLLSIDKIEKTSEIYSNYSQSDIEMNMSVLNKINILRRGKNNSLREAKYFFLTATNLCLNLAKEADGMREGAVPLASTCEFFIDKIWVKINRNFANINIKSLDVVARAQIAISSILNFSIERKVAEVEKKYRSKNISREEADAALVEIRKVNTDSEQIGEENIDPILIFTEEGIDAYIDNHNFQAKQAQDVAERNKELLEGIKQKEEIIKQLEEEKYAEQSKRKKRTRILKSVGFIVLTVIILTANYFINKRQVDNDILTGIFSTLAFVSALVGILGFFGVDYRNLVSKIKK